MLHATETPCTSFEYVHKREDGDCLSRGMHNFNSISLAPVPAEVQVQQMLCDPRMHGSQAHLCSLSLATHLAQIKSIMFHNCGQKLSCSEFIFWVDILPTSAHMNQYEEKVIQTLIFSQLYYYYCQLFLQKKSQPTLW